MVFISFLINSMLFPSHLPPSKGGKYAGFGYSKEPMPKSQSQEFFDTTVSSLASVSDFVDEGTTEMCIFENYQSLFFGFRT